MKMETLGERIVNARNKKGYSQEKFAEQLGVSRQMVSRWELNTAVPRMSRMEKICELLDLTANELINGTNSDESLSKQSENSQETVANGYKTLKFKALIRRTALILLKVFIALLILYVAYTSFKFIVLKHVINEVIKYENLDNYYCKITSHDENEKDSTKEIWYKDGMYKIINTEKINEIDVRAVLLVDVNNKCRYQIDESNKSAKKRNLTQLNMYQDGRLLYDSFPAKIKKDFDYISAAFKINKILYYKKENSYCLKINNSKIHLNKDTYLPQLYTIEQKDKNNIITEYDIKLDIVQDEDINVPNEYTIQ